MSIDVRPVSKRGSVGTPPESGTYATPAALTAAQAAGASPLTGAVAAPSRVVLADDGTREMNVTTNGTTTVTGAFVASDDGLVIVKSDIPAGATLSAIAVGVSATISQAATGSSTGRAQIQKSTVPWQGWPSITRCPDGRLLAIWRRAGGASGTSFFGATRGIIYTAYSSDLGRTWTAPTVFYDGGTGVDARGVTVSTVGTRLFAAFITITSPATNGFTFVRYSDDNGATWSSLIAIPALSGSNPLVHSTDRVQKTANGRLILSVYGSVSGDSFTSTGFSFSDDNGRTWSQFSRTFNGNTDSTPYNETEVAVFPNGHLVALIRTSDTHMYRSVSTDNGATWTAPVAVFVCIPGKPAVCVTSSGALVCVYRSGAVSRPAAVRTSYDEGLTWTAENNFAYSHNLSAGSAQYAYAEVIEVAPRLMCCIVSLDEGLSDSQGVAHIEIKYLVEGSGVTPLGDVMSVPSVTAAAPAGVARSDTAVAPRQSVYRTAGTYTWRNPKAGWVRILLHGASSGGGSGARRVSGSNCSGGGGSAAGGEQVWEGSAAALADQLDIIIGAGGGGGAAVTTDDTAGNPGTLGGTSYVVAHGGALSAAFMSQLAGAVGGAGGLGSGSAGGAPRAVRLPGGAGGGDSSGAAGTAGSAGVSGGGGAGGGISNTPTAFAGGAGGAAFDRLQFTAPTGGAVNSNGTPAAQLYPASGTNPGMPTPCPGGGGGGASITGAGGNGGNAADGGGAGGGGASLNGQNSGKGGDGSDAWCVITVTV